MTKRLLAMLLSLMMVVALAPMALAGGIFESKGNSAIGGKNAVTVSLTLIQAWEMRIYPKRPPL